MRRGVWARERFRQKNLAANARETNPIFHAQQIEQQMIARVPAGGKSEIKTHFGQPPVNADRFYEWPTPDMVFAFKSSPRRNISFDMDIRPKARLQVERKRFGQKGHLKFLRCGAKKWRGDGEIAESPHFDDEQFGFQRIALPMKGRLESHSCRNDGSFCRCGYGFGRRLADSAVERDAQPDNSRPFQQIAG